MSRPFFTPDAATPAGRVFYLAVMPLALLCAGLEQRLIGPLRKRDTHTSSHFRDEV